MITIKPMPISQLVTHRHNNTLRINPEYQRRSVWNAKVKMLLIDSLARQIPVGALTFYEDRSEGYTVFEVIDGKQRLTSLFDFIDGKLVVSDAIVASADEDDEPATVGEALAQQLYNRSWEELTTPQRTRFQEYEFPVFIVSGSRAEAVQAFTRMNLNPFALKPQEIRNAMFAGTGFLQAVTGLSDRLDQQLASADRPYFVALDVMTKSSWDRMQDLQLHSELLALVLQGVQHRRDTLNDFYEMYRSPKGDLKQTLEEHTSRLERICQQIWLLFGGEALTAYHFPKSAENDFYALVGAFHERGVLSNPQVRESGADLVEQIKEFRRQVTLYVNEVRSGDEMLGEFSALVIEYGKTFLGGQVNSDKRRRTRIDVWKQVINDVVQPVSPDHFSPLQRQLIWASSADKICPRCEEVVEYKDFQAGHKVPRAKGGNSVLSNGQIEHSWCNQKAGADA